MQELTPRDVQRRTQIESKFEAIKYEMKEKIAAATAAIEALNIVIDVYNEVVDEAVNLRDDIVNEMDEFYNSKSERWQEGDKGEAYHKWKEEWEDLDLEIISQSSVSDAIPDMDDLAHATLLHEAPVQPDG